MKKFYSVLVVLASLLFYAHQASAQISISTSSTDVNCFDGIDGTVTANVLSGPGPYTYVLIYNFFDGSFSEIGRVSNTMATSVTFSKANGNLNGNAPFGGIIANPTGENYQINVIGNCAVFGCSKSQLRTVSQPAAALAPAASVAPDCDPAVGTGQGTITITTTGGTAPYSYSWSDGVNTQNRTNVDAGSYTLTVTDAKNCTANLVVTVPILTQANAGAPQDVCATSTTMAANAVGAGEQGVWAVISGSGTFGTPNSPTSTVTGLALGANVFEWRISDTGGHCTGTTSQVTVNSYAPATVDAGLPQTICAGSPTSALSGTIGGEQRAPPGLPRAPARLAI